MYIVEPAEPNGGACRSAGVFVKSVAYVVTASVREPAEDDVGSCLHNGIKILIFTGKFGIQVL